MTGTNEVYKKGNKPDIEAQEAPGLQHAMHTKPLDAQLPTGVNQTNTLETYKAAGKLTGKAALITGGDSGIGRSVALLFAKEGADVAINYMPDREEEDAQETKRLVEKEGHRCFLIPKDLRGEKNCQEIAAQALKELGHIEILVNNAAYQMECERLEDLKAEQIEYTFQVNILSQFYLTKALLPHMKAGASIINNTSINAFKGNPKLLDYTATKGAILAFTRALSQQIAGERGIRVNAVAPGPILTPLIPATMGEASRSAFGQNTPLGRPGQPIEVATCFVFLASNDSSYITGQTLHPNGGTSY